MKPIDIILIILIAAAVILSLRSTIKKFKSGGCCGDCTKCGTCSVQPTSNKKER